MAMFDLAGYNEGDVYGKQTGANRTNNPAYQPFDSTPTFTANPVQSAPLDTPHMASNTYNPQTGGFTGPFATGPSPFTDVQKNPTQLGAYNQDQILSNIGSWAAMPGANPSLTTDPGYWARRINETGGLGSSNTDYWKNLAMRPEGAPESWSPQNPNGSGGYSNTGLFDDPNSAAWLKLLQGRVNALNTPYTPPDMGGLTDYLKSYFQKLQGPAYSPQQLDLLQTQSLDPLSRERDAVRQRITEQASARGLDPKSGIVQKQLSDAENQFEQIRTRTQAGFASKAVDLDRINAQQAASVGQLLNNIEQTNFNSNEQRANQALGYAQQVPDYARQTMLDAQGLLGQNQISPTSLLQLSQQGNQFDSQNTQSYITGLASLLPYLLPYLIPKK